MWLSLIGFMASGKSTVARELAERALLEVCDLDVAIEAAAGARVAEIFADEGEAAFRRRELAALEALPAGEDLVVACGGGVVETPAACDLLRERGAVVWLDAPWERLRRRLEAAAPGERPLLDAGWAEVEARLRRRLPLYAAAAHVRLRSDLATPRELASRVLACRTRLARRTRSGTS